MRLSFLIGLDEQDRSGASESEVRAAAPNGEVPDPAGGSAWLDYLRIKAGPDPRPAGPYHGYNDRAGGGGTYLGLPSSRRSFPCIVPTPVALSC